MKNQSIEKIDRPATAEEIFLTSGDEAAGALIQTPRQAQPAHPALSIDYHWYEVCAEELISLMAVCSSGVRN